VLEIKNSCLASFYFSKFLYSALNHVEELPKDNIPTIFLLFARPEVLIMVAIDIMGVAAGVGEWRNRPSQQSSGDSTMGSKINTSKETNILS
jgi:hypothetical protein